MTNRHSELLQQATAYLLDNGVANLSLRPMAAALGTSARMLVYHFGSKDDLIVAATSEVRSRFQTALEEAFAGPRTGVSHPLLTFWDTLIDPDNLRSVRLLFEVEILALQNPKTYGRYLDQASTGWLEVIERILRPEIRSPTMARLCYAVVDGLLLQVLSTGERRPATEALQAFLDSLTKYPWSPEGIEGSSGRTGGEGDEE
jgi:AcrR family transcriptional regulator